MLPTRCATFTISCISPFTVSTLSGLLLSLTIASTTFLMSFIASFSSQLYSVRLPVSRPLLSRTADSFVRAIFTKSNNSRPSFSAKSPLSVCFRSSVNNCFSKKFVSDALMRRRRALYCSLKSLKNSCINFADLSVPLVEAIRAASASDKSPFTRSNSAFEPTAFNSLDDIAFKF